MKLKENDNVPEIRFDYFKEEWDRKRFKDFTKLSQGLQIAISSRFLEDGEHRYFYITNEFLNPNSTKKYYIESPSENVICTVDDILMTRTGNTGKVITNISGAFHNNFFKVDYDKFETSKMFLYYLLTSNDIQKEIIIRAGNSTIPDLNHSDFYSIKTSVPALAEQTAIGSLFRTLDELLASYKDNLANYQSLKATMLSKMFPKAGQTVPEIRLDGFEGEWEIKRADEIFKSVSEKNRASLPVLSASQIDGMVLRDEIGIDIKYDEATLNNYKVVKPGQFVIHLRSFQGGFALSKLEGITSPAYTIIDFIDKANNLPDFWNSILTSRDFIKRLETVTYGIRDGKSISFKDFSSLKFVFPEFKEQQVIGSYFSNLDSLINSHQEKITQLETLKKKLLQDMFI